MKIYTKTGDQGETGLFGGKRVRKNHPRISAYGEVDELNALLGVARSLNRDASVDDILKKTQNNLFELGAILASPDKNRLKGKATGFIGEEDVVELEEAIDRMDCELPPLRNFILPGGSGLASSLHVARAVCRRAERRIITLADQEGAGSVEEVIFRYINRLSDFLFVLARWIHFKEGVVESKWEKK